MWLMDRINCISNQDLYICKIYVELWIAIKWFEDSSVCIKMNGLYFIWELSTFRHLDALAEGSKPFDYLIRIGLMMLES